MADTSPPQICDPDDYERVSLWLSRDEYAEWLIEQRSRPGQKLAVPIKGQISMRLNQPVA